MTSRVAPEPPIPVTLVTGYLGSGKTTLLRHLLDQPELGETAVIVNEFGDIGLDHLLLERGDETTVLLDGGCLCCTLQEDLVTTLQNLLDRRERGEVPRFTRVMIETTGLADPGTLIRMFWSDPLRLSLYDFDRTVTCVDAVSGPSNLKHQHEARRQVAFAGLLVVTKTDLGEADAVLADVFALNGEAVIVTAAMGAVPVDILTSMDGRNDSPEDDDDVHISPHSLDDIVTVSCTFHDSVPWTRFETSLAEMVERYGGDLLRVKGLLAVDGVDGMVRIDAVQGCFHRPQVLSVPAGGQVTSRVAVIAQGLDKAQLRRDLDGLFDLSAEDVLRRA